MGTRRKTKQTGEPRHYIKQWRLYRGLTQQKLADRIGAGVSSISQLENAQQGYSQAILEALAVALACEPWDLLNVDPAAEGEVIDLTRMLKGAKPEVQAEAIGYVKGLLRRAH